MRIKKEALAAAICAAADRMFRESAVVPEQKLYLTQRQYDLDPEGWKKILRDKGLPETNIEIIPEVYNPD